VNPSATGPIEWVVGGEGGMMHGATLNPDLGVATTAATIDSVEVALGPTKSALLAIQSVARDEIVIARIATQGARCGGPAPAPVSGIIIDNLRTVIDPGPQ
jgi:hypothetical protein